MAFCDPVGGGVTLWFAKDDPLFLWAVGGWIGRPAIVNPLVAMATKIWTKHTICEPFLEVQLHLNIFAALRKIFNYIGILKVKTKANSRTYEIADDTGKIKQQHFGNLITSLIIAAEVSSAF